MSSNESAHDRRRELQVLLVGVGTDLREWVRTALDGIPHRRIEWERLSPPPRSVEGPTDPDLVLIEETPSVTFPADLRALKQKHPRCQVLLLSRPDSNLSPRQIGSGVIRHWFFRPLEGEEFVRTLQAAGRSLSRSFRDRQRHSRDLTGLDALLGEHPALLETKRLARRVALSASTSVLILGETGTGKGLLARGIHGESPRAEGPFVEINCAAIPPQLLESELFGHVRGAFTSAVKDKPGLLELADGGTVFLDEIGELDVALQAKILKFLDDGVVRRVQGTSTVKVDVRMVAATNRDLEREVEEGGFRRDLYHRLNVVVLRVPPLRERPGDIPMLARHYLGELSRKIRGRVIDWGPETLEILTRYSWPGNVRELINLAERIALLSDGSRPVQPAELPEGVVPGAPILRLDGAQENPSVEIPPQGIAFEALERAILTAALRQTGGNVTQAASILKMGRGGLRYRLERLGLQDQASNRRGRPMGRRRKAA